MGRKAVASGELAVKAEILKLCHSRTDTKTLQVRPLSFLVDWPVAQALCGCRKGSNRFVLAMDEFMITTAHASCIATSVVLLWSKTGERTIGI
jgi:hypothetical protein